MKLLLIFASAALTLAAGKGCSSSGDACSALATADAGHPACVAREPGQICLQEHGEITSCESACAEGEYEIACFGDAGAPPDYEPPGCSAQGNPRPPEISLFCCPCSP